MVFRDLQVVEGERNVMRELFIERLLILIIPAGYWLLQHY